ncbi:unnamed protein product [Allacma fusca]|uniref:Farnesyl pyrophosphate synthase n=1 Tax=Allacma fusca TaxID=39272 RepID=A0A8J2JKY5_9HEXA|nr:unnamed protein product [Allacma fusca]
MELSKEDVAEFNATFEDILNVLRDDPGVKNTPGGFQWLEELLRYNVLDGKKLRARLFLAASFELAPEQSLQERKMVLIMGWLMEMIQAECLICDDIMDNATHRRGRTCWHLLPHIGMSATNDFLAIDKCVFLIIKKYFRDQSYYADLVDLFNESIFIGTLGQNLDFRMESQKLQFCTKEVYEKIIAAKACHYGFYLPVAVAMLMACEKRKTVDAMIQDILMDIGMYFSIQDDFLDAFGESTNIGKDGTDISNGKCTWPLITALELASTEQKAELEENYGQKDEAKVARVKEIYADLKIPEIYTSIQSSGSTDLFKSIEKLPNHPVRKFLKMITKALIHRHF